MKDTKDIDIAFRLLNGYITYTAPKHFNDPFDCDFTIYNLFGLKMNTNFKNDMRVLSLTNRYDDICMWGYYGGNHEGVCVGHALSDYLSSTISNIDGFIIYGNIKYSNVRPKYRIASLNLDSIPIFYFLNCMTKCCFTKYRKWKTENEFRIITMIDFFKSNESVLFSEDKNYISVKGNVKEIYLGCRNFSNLNKFPVKCVKLKKSFSHYKLVKTI